MKRLIKDGVYTDAAHDIAAEFKSEVLDLLRAYLDKYDAIDVEHILVNTLRGMCSMERLKYVAGTNSCLQSEPVFQTEKQYREFAKEFYETVQTAHSKSVEQSRKDNMAWRRDQLRKFLDTDKGKKMTEKMTRSARQVGKTKLYTHAVNAAKNAYAGQDGKNKCSDCSNAGLQELHTAIGEYMSNEPVSPPTNFQDVIDDILWDRRKPSHVVMDECTNVDKSQWIGITDDTQNSPLDKFKDTLKKSIH